MTDRSMGERFMANRGRGAQQGKRSVHEIPSEQPARAGRNDGFPRGGSYGGTRGGGGGGRGGGRRQRQDVTRLPLEQGSICSLKDSFGFITCADRPEEMFFHYSEVQGVHPADLQINDEMEFRVGASSKDSDKLAAYQLRKLEPGTIVWEVEEEPGKVFRGLVERPTRFDRGSTIDGTIRMLIEKEEDGETIEAPDGPLVRFTAKDFEDDGGGRRPKRLARGDLVEFGLLTQRRTKDRYAKGIQLLLAERDRARQEEERRMLAEATEEHGVVTALKGEYGFLRSNKRREEVYFHYSSMDLPAEGEDDLVLKEGQEMKFLVVHEPGEHERAQRRVSARRVQMQPRGSVRFHDALACGVTGIVTISPQPVDQGHSLEARGRVELDEPVTDTDVDGNDRIITEVYLSTKDSPGGSYNYRGGTSAATWVQVGDKLLFDVVRDFVDGACHAAPTRHLVPNENPLVLEDEGNENDPARRVRLIGMSPIGRAEGVVNAVKDTYGFIHFAERPVDVHFKLFQQLPEDLQTDVRRNMGIANVDDQGKPLQLEVGAEVQYDISVHGRIHSSNSSRHRARQPPSSLERENLKAQRVLLLPPGTIQANKVLATGIRGTIGKEDPRQPYAGMVELDTPVNPMTLEDRHPLVAKMIKSYVESGLKIPMVYHDILSAKEEDVVLQMIDLLAKDKLSWSHIPQPGETQYPGKLCIRKVADSEAAEVAADGESAKSTDDVEESKSDDGGHLGESPEKSSKSKSSKRKAKTPKPVQSIRYDKASMGRELKDDMPPSVGDVVEFDVVQSRRTGQLSIESMRIIERKAVDATDMETITPGLGIVKEVVPQRNFGFIHVLDENASKKDLLFFSLANIVSDGGPAGKKVRKGDEVKFDVGTEKNGKRVALNVTVVPNGTIPNKADKNACQGLVLLEPSHSTLKNTPLRKKGSSGSNEGSRWETASDREVASESLVEDGCVLLLEDKTNMFSRTPIGSKSSSQSENDNPPSSEGDAKSSSEVTLSGSEASDAKECVKRHLRYKLGAIAIHGAGSTTATDGSSNPKRGDLVSFVKGKGGGLRDIRIVNRGAATLIRGRLEDIQVNDDAKSDDGSSLGRAKFVAATDGEETYDIDLSEVVSCKVGLLKDKESVEGIIHDGAIYGVCRTIDLYLESKLGSGHKQRPKLNLTVKKDRGGTIMAQSMMAKGPDGTNGFAAGWTKRVSKFVDLATEPAAGEADEEKKTGSEESPAPDTPELLSEA